MAKNLPADGLEMYEGFLWETSDSYLGKIRTALADANFLMPMLCCSPDFTHPTAQNRIRAIEYQKRMIEVAYKLGGPGTVCRVLSGQRWPEVSLEQGLEFASQAIIDCLKTAEDLGVILGIENHYKDGFGPTRNSLRKKRSSCNSSSEFHRHPISVFNSTQATLSWPGTIRSNFSMQCYLES